MPNALDGKNNLCFFVENWYNEAQGYRANDCAANQERMDNTMKRLIPFLLVLAMLFCACAQPQEDTKPTGGQTAASDPTTTAPTTTAPTDVPDNTTVPPQTSAPKDEPVLSQQHPLTGEAMENPSLNRPVAVMLNNIKAAMPQHGVSQADILYEVLAEGGITRCLGIFTDLENVEKVGSIRSARKYFVELAQGYDAAYVHAGGSGEATNYLSTLKNMNLDAGLSATHFYRDQDRLNSGYSLEHTLFGSGEKILAFAKQQGVSTRLTEAKTYAMTFDDSKVIVGKDAKKVTVYFNMGGKPGAYTKSTVFSYDDAAKTYLAAQHGGDYIDGNTKETVAFRNVVVLYASTNVQSDGKLLTIKTTGTGSGHFACNGQMVSIRWSRASVSDPFTFTLDNGSPVTFGTGSTYIAVVPTGATVTSES